MQNSRALALDLARFAAALGVLYYHWFHFYEPGHSPATYGYLGVPFFFMVSGYVISLTAEGRTRSRFLKARAVRLLPAFFLCVSLTTLVMVADGQMPSTRTFLANLTFVAPLFGQPYLDGVYWTLSVEVTFYALVCVFALGPNLRRNLRALVLIWSALAALAQLFPQLHLIPYLGFGPYFGTGVMLSIWERERRRIDLMLLGGFVLLATVAAYDHSSAYQRAVPIISSALVFGMGAALPLLAKVRLPRERFWVTLGAISYPLYLLNNEFAMRFLGYSAVATLAGLLAICYAISRLELHIRGALRPAAPSISVPATDQA